jgi:predicted PurR-regulated permease PerM
MTDQPDPAPAVSSFTPALNEREHRWLTALLILGTVAAAFLVLHYVAELVLFFGDVIMIFFLAWLLAFILSPVASALLRLVPGLPRALAVILVYALLVAVLIAAVVVIAQQLYNSITNLVYNWPSDQRLQELLAPYQSRLDSFGGGQIHLADQLNQLLNSVKSGASDLAKPLGDIAVASLGVFGNMLFVFFLSLYMAVDRDHIVRFLFRLVPPYWTEEAKLLERSVSRSFGGFLRGQAIMGLIYGLVAVATSLLLGLPYTPVTATAAGVLQAIPFFGPFFSWAPPVLVALFFKPEATLPTLLLMIVGWFVVMNVIQPRLMSQAVGLHPVVVLGSVLIGTKIAGVPGAIFGIPVAAVISAFFFYWLGQRHSDAGPVAVRAARRVEEREGRVLRVPRLPQAGEDQEVEGAAPVEPQPVVRRRRQADGRTGAASDKS